MDETQAVQADSTFTVVTRDPDEARQIASDSLYTQRPDVLDRDSPLVMTMHAGRIGPIFIGDCHYNTGLLTAVGHRPTNRSSL